MKALSWAVSPRLPISKGSLNWLIFCLLMVIAGHVTHIPVWAALGALFIVVWRLRMVRKRSPLPANILRFMLTAGAIAGVVVTYRSYLGRDPGITALVILSSLKLLELKSHRDFMFVVFLCYFLVLGNFLYTQSIPSLIFMAAAVILITAAILRLNYQESESLKTSSLLKSAAKLFIFSLPFMLVLFFLFPRTSGPLWNLPQDPEGKYRSGFNDSIYPGQIAQLANSKIPAFRVTFPDDNLPRHKDLYFRGVILWFTNGRRWVQGILPARRPRQINENPEAGIRQEIILEPHFRRWLFALDMPTILPYWSRQLPGRIFHTRRIVERYVSYRVTSQVDYRSAEELTATFRRWALQLPRDLSRRIRELALSWREQAASDSEIVQSALDYFRDPGFVYTLKPGVMDRERPFEDFLFNKKKGFCEHYAGAFALLLRAAGVPTRILTGYQGGIYNPVGKYLLVRQSEAHAWCEVWLEGEGWRRIDPTAVISPERIEYGIDMSNTLSSLGGAGDDRQDAIDNALRRGFFKNLFQTLEDYWDTINNKWNLWIMSYDLYRQRSFLESLGIEHLGRWTLVVFIILIVAGLLILFSFLLRRKSALSEPLLELYRRFCNKLGRAGLRRLAWEGPLDFARRAAAKFPRSAGDIEQVTNLFIELRYGRQAVDDLHLKELKKHIARLAPKTEH
ncbi:MAG: DUF3488 domain-containing transglutaminase family protein [Candidatus Aminicenantes bacterium]|nr:DUF3488 domain-containing transglutaminase family protein [Candidatus Aminicenantes bacterium]